MNRALQRPTQLERGRQTLINTAGTMRENARNQRISTHRNGPMGTFSRDTAEETVPAVALAAAPTAGAVPEGTGLSSLQRAAAAAPAGSADTEQVAFGEQPTGDLHADAWNSTDEYRDL